ncbi:MAG: hypothetical protein K2M47_04360 [Clostridiales bacterium]|nr:hypothetical protein [Clostridiales bacterium]MDE6201092.1 hypothetical protein [Clostridiales bacterium]
MKTSYQDVAFVLSYYNLDGFNDNEKLIGAITELWDNSKNLFGMPDKLISLFHNIADYELDKKTAKKIVYDIHCQNDLSYIYDELLACDVLKDKLTVDRKNFVITLKVHDNFIVKSYLTLQKTYINDKFYYDIEDQDLLACYCDFVQDDCFHAQYRRRRLLSYLHLTNRYLKDFKNANKIEKYKNNKNVEMIFTNKELIYSKN